MLFLIKRKGRYTFEPVMIDNACFDVFEETMNDVFLNL